jgi:sugar O-acyltransferase (sialic acid O-acetyltransferase NeuD family)
MNSYPREIVIIGSGGAAAEVFSCIQGINSISSAGLQVIGFLDDNKLLFKNNSEKYQFELPLLGSTKDYEYTKKYSYVVAFSNIAYKKILTTKLLGIGVSFPNIIHPSAEVSSSAKLGFGNIIGSNCIIGPATFLGNFNLLTSYSFVSHDCSVGSFNFFSTAGLSGGATVADENFFGIRSTLLPSVTVGSRCMIQAGMVIDKDVLDDSTVFYRYKEKIIAIR